MLLVSRTRATFRRAEFRLLRRGRNHARADSTTLRGRVALLATLTGLQARREHLLLGLRAALAYELIDAGHAAGDGSSGAAIGCIGMAHESRNGGGSAGLDHHRGGSGEPLVLIHGIGHTWRGWKPMLPELERRFDVRRWTCRLRPLGAPAGGHRPDRRGARGRGRAPDARHGLRHGAHRGQLARRLDRARARPPRAGPHRDRDIARRTSTRARDGIGRRHPASDALAGRERSRPEAAMRNPVTRCFLAGPAVARPWRYDPDLLIEATELYASCPGLHPTLPHLLDRQPRGLTTPTSPC